MHPNNRRSCPLILVTLVTLVTIGACGDRATQVGAGADSAVQPMYVDDPGQPATPYGPKCDVRFDLGDIPPILDQCSAVATISGGWAHLYLQLYPGREPAGLERYVSIVFAAREWAARTYAGVIGGRMEIAPADGRRYQLAAAPGAGFEVDLQLQTVSGPGTDGEYYIRGILIAVLPGLSGTPGQVVLTARINTPM